MKKRLSREEERARLQAQEQEQAKQLQALNMANLTFDDLVNLDRTINEDEILLSRLMDINDAYRDAVKATKRLINLAEGLNKGDSKRAENDENTFTQAVGNLKALQHSGLYSIYQTAWLILNR